VGIKRLDGTVDWMGGQVCYADQGFRKIHTMDKRFKNQWGSFAKKGFGSLVGSQRNATKKERALLFGTQQESTAR